MTLAVPAPRSAALRGGAVAGLVVLVALGVRHVLLVGRVPFTSLGLESGVVAVLAMGVATAAGLVGRAKPTWHGGDPWFAVAQAGVVGVVVLATGIGYGLRTGFAAVPHGPASFLIQTFLALVFAGLGVVYGVVVAALVFVGGFLGTALSTLVRSGST